MFPFNLPGPAFLVFFVVYCIAIHVGYRIYAQMALAGGATPRLTELAGNPYQVAYLRDGPEETVRVAVVNLIDRGLLMMDASERIRRADDKSIELARHALDQAILEECARPRRVSELSSSPRVKAACVEFEARLKAKGLVPDDAALRAIKAAFRVAAGLVVVLVGVRFVQAWFRGQNVEGLLVVTVVALIVLYQSRRRWRTTSAGREALASLKKLVERSKPRLRAGGSTNEALLFAAVCGIWALPASQFPFVTELYPKPAASGGNGGDGGSSSCSSGCGGGGGCGGCGG